MVFRYFAEYLPRIASISLVVEVDADVSVTGIRPVAKNVLSVELDGTRSEEVPLPQDIDLERLEPDFKETVEDGLKVMRLRIHAARQESETSGSVVLLSDRAHTWSKEFLAQYKQLNFICAACGKVVVGGADVRKIHDAPSETWAEMMDFWHCHKPDVEVSETIKARYNGLKPGPNAIVVGGHYLLVNIGDFGLKSPSCACGAELGSLHSNNTVKINKWCLKLNDDLVYRPFFHAYDVILDNINFHASRFYNLVDEETESQSLVVWVFNFGLSVSSSADNAAHTGCLKVMYYKGHEEKFDDIALPAVVIADLEAKLQESNQALCRSISTMQQWKCAYIYV